MNADSAADCLPKIMFVTSVCPHAKEYGAQQRVLNVLRILKDIGDISILLLVDHTMDPESLRKTHDEFGKVRLMAVRENPLTGLRDRLRFELDSQLVNTSLFGIGREDQALVESMIERHDLCWIHTLRTANECGIYKWPRSILDLDDIPSQLSATNAAVQDRLVRRLAALRMAMIWKRREQRVFERFDRVVVCSELDRRYIGSVARVSVIPNGFEEPPSKPLRAPARPPRFGFIGALWGRPNQEGVSWFIAEVWPLVKMKVPDAALRLVGEPAGHIFVDKGLGIEQLGHLANPNDEILTWSAMVVPIRVGGGTRVKIAQAFAQNCPVISTTLGAYGYSVRNGEDILLADDAQAFAQACVRLVDDPELGATIAERAWAQFQTSLTWRAVRESLTQLIERFFSETRELGQDDSPR